LRPKIKSDNLSMTKDPFKFFILIHSGY